MASEKDRASEAKQPTLFLSYAHADAKRAEALAAALGQRGYTVWWDNLIEGGASFARSIRAALEAADAVVVLWSTTSIDSDWVADEAAQGRDRRRLVPISLDGSLPPLGFRQYQTIDLTSRSLKPSAAQVDRIERAIAAAIGQEAAPRLPSASRSIDRRRALVLGGGAVAVLAGGGTLFAIRDNLFESSPADHSIAVLPFKNLSSDAAQAYLSDGLTDEVRAALTRNAGLMVLAATTSNAARDDGGDAKAIAGKLGVAHLLGGSVQRAGDVVRVSIDLTDGKTGFSTWSKRIDARLSDIFAFQSEVARTVSEALSVRMATQDPAPGGTRSVAAYESYLRGKSLYNLSKDEATDRQAKALFENALVADPDFALAHAALSRVLASIAGLYVPGPEIKPTFAAAIVQGRKAVQLAPTLAEGHLALGFATFAGTLDVRGARQSYEQAYRYGRGNGDILLIYALYSVRARRNKQALDAISNALALDPLNPRTHRGAGVIAFAVRDFASAIAHFRRALALNPAMTNSRAGLAASLAETGKIDEARTLIAAEPSVMFRLTGQAILEHRAGNRAAATKAYGDLVRKLGDAALYQQAQVMAQWGHADAAMGLLERARAVGDSGLMGVASDPLLDPLTKDRRFTAFIDQLGFT